ncbi:MAG: alpha-mannosidase [Candidatus Lokiarchaeota archaeon]|nr:alpha-mannosidase [Candidatus Lokiarchaeota archaeon]
MVEELLARTGRDKLIKWLDKRNFFYPGSYILSQVIALFYGAKKKDYDGFSLIGQSHLDACWLWTRKKTIQKNYITVKKALIHMEDYPFFKFAMSSPKYFEWTEKYFPSIFKRMKKRIEEGRFELVGGMWIEPDLMVPNGESLVRQRLYGQRYYLEKFGKMSEIGWLTDVFGYQWSLPQILVKSGSKYFYTNKLGWMDQNDFPFSIFNWQAPDGSQVLTYAFSYSINLFAMKQNFGSFKKFTRFVKDAKKQFSYEDSPEEIEKLRSKEYMRNFGLVYGMGDGGGGPIREEIIILKNMASRFPKNIKFSLMKDYFKEIEKNKDKIPTWNDEMYLEQHRGCYTSHVWLKELNRKAEIMFYQVEILISFLKLLGLKFNNEKIKKNWLQLLFNQFHDILPGSSIADVYVDTRIDFSAIFGNLNKYIQMSLKYLGSKINFLGEGILIFNSLPFERNAFIELDSNQDFSLKTPNGQQVLLQKSNGKSLLQIKLPKVGYTILKREKDSITQNKTDLEISEDNSKITLENDNLIVNITKKTGDITRIYSKSLNKEALTGKGNVIQIFKEKKTSFFAWNIDKYYSKNKFLPKLKSISIIERGPVRIRVKIEKLFEEQSIIQYISLNSLSSRVDMELDMKFHVKAAMVKVAFPINIETNEINAEIPYAIIQRKSKPSNRFDEAQWEQNCQTYVTLSDNDISISLLNNARYAYDVKYHDKFKNILRLTILRTPVYPRAGSPLTSMIPTNNWHEQDQFNVKYSLLMTKGNVTNPEIKQGALDINIPPLLQEITNLKGDLSEEMSFLEVIPTNVILSALKLPEDGEVDDNSIIIRCYEAVGIDSKAKIRFNKKFQILSIEEVDLLELNPKKINSFKDNVLDIDIKKFEIKTLKIKLTVV